MSDPFIGQITLFGGNFAPAGWALCEGQLLPIAQNTALFSILGTTYGGDGETTFALPDLRGRVPIQHGQGPGLSSYNLGQEGGQENVTLSTNQIPSHTHTLRARDASADQVSPTNHALATAEDANRNGLASYVDAAPDVDMRAGSIQNAGGGQAHPNIQPFLGINFIIAVVGLFPSQS